MVKCLLVDDEPNAHLVLLNFINRTDGLELVAQAYQLDTAKELVQKQHIDLLFLDINLAGQSGFDLISLCTEDTRIILTTAYADFALKSFEFGVIDYLLKPFSYERFLQSIDRYFKLSGRNPVQQNVEFKVDGNFKSFNVKDIVYLQSWGNYVKLFTKDKEYLCSCTTTEVVNALPKRQFKRIHKSYVVNTDFINKQEGDFIILSNQSYLPVGITYRRSVLDYIQ